MKEIFKEYFKLSKSYQTILKSCVSGRLTSIIVLLSAHDQLNMQFAREQISKFLGGALTHYQPNTHPLGTYSASILTQMCGISPT